MFAIAIEIDSVFEGEEVFIIRFQNNEGSGRLTGAVFDTGSFQTTSIHIIDGKD